MTAIPERDDEPTWTVTFVPPPWYVRAYYWSGLDWVGCLIVSLLLGLPAYFTRQPLFLLVYVLLIAAQVAEHREREGKYRRRAENGSEERA